MDKEEKLERVCVMIDQLGLSLGELIDYKKRKNEEKAAKLNSKRATTLDERFYNVNLNISPGKIKPGMYVYTNGCITSDIISGAKIKGVVGWLERTRVLVVSLREKNLWWSSDGLAVKATVKMVEGQEATRKIVEVANRKNKRAEAAEWCYNFAEDGVEPGEAFLPSESEWHKLFFNLEKINKALNDIKALPLSYVYWASNEVDNQKSNAHTVRTGYSHKYCAGKTMTTSVRPVFWIECNN